MGKAIKATGVSCLFLAYPFLSHYLAKNGFVSVELALIACLMLWRSIKATQTTWQLAMFSFSMILFGGAYFTAAYFIWLIPAAVYLGLTVLFGYSLWSPPSICERLVRLLYPEFKPGISRYLHQLTWVWTLFFAANIVVCALLPLWAGEKIWTLYTGVIVYLLMGALITSEWLYRHRRFPDLDIPPILETVKFFALNGHKVFKDHG
jgi:uncharacterized membrane protein